MVWKKLSALTAALLPLAAQALAAPKPEHELTAVVVVEGLARDDLLNVRATASATGMVIGRLPNGSTLKNLGCDQINGYQWCKIVAAEDETLHGWTPARYLQAVPGSAPVEDAAATTETADASEQGGTLAPAESVSQAPEIAEASLPPAASADEIIAALGGAATPSVSTAGAGSSAEPAPALEDQPAGGEAEPPVPTDLAARWGDQPSGMLALGSGQDPSSLVKSDAVVSAFKMAFAATGAPPAGELYTLGAGREGKPEPAESALANGAASDKAVPVPPQATATASAAQGARLAQVQAGSAAPAYDVVGEIPCARYIGQAMMRCEATVARTGAEAADVTVTLPDGGKRTIQFREGKPEGSNSRGEFRFTREGELSMIRVGVSERFEIPDSLAFGD